MPKPCWPLQPWAQPYPETAFSLAVGAPSPGGCQPWAPLATAHVLPGGGTGSRLQRGWGLPQVGLSSCLGRAKLQLVALVPAPGAVVLCPQAPPGAVPALRNLPLPEFGEKGGGGNRTGAVAAARPVSVIYIVYKSIKLSVLLSAILPGALVLLQGKTAWGGGSSRQPSTNQDPF